MRLIPAIQVYDAATTGALAEFVSCNIPEPDPDNSDEASAAIYDSDDAPFDAGARVIKDHILYQSATGSNSDVPAHGSETWVTVGPSNQWKALTLTTAAENASTYDDEIVYTIDLLTSADSVALHEIEGQSANVKFYDPDDVLVYDQTISTASLDGVDDEYDWCFRDPIRANQLAGFDIPPYESGTLVVTVSAPSSTAQIGKIVFGYSEGMGEALSPVRTDLIDLSRSSRNQYGNTVLIPGRQIFTTSIDSKIESSRASYLKRVVKNLQGKPATVIGEPDNDFTIIYGRVIDYRVTLNAHPTSFAVLETEDF